MDNYKKLFTLSGILILISLYLFFNVIFTKAYFRRSQGNSPSADSYGRPYYWLYGIGDFATNNKFKITSGELEIIVYDQNDQILERQTFEYYPHKDIEYDIRIPLSENYYPKRMEFNVIQFEFDYLSDILISLLLFSIGMLVIRSGYLNLKSLGKEKEKQIN